MIVVVFRARVRALDTEYAKAAARLRDLALREHGCLAFHAVTEGDEEISISHWPDEASVRAWREHPEHVRAQRLGRERWYASWSVHVAELRRTHEGVAPAPPAAAVRPRAAPLPVHVRDAVRADVPAMLAIYAPVVEHTPISFELTPPSEEKFAARHEKYARGWSWLVAEADGSAVGYAYGSPHRERAAYRLSTETSVFVAEDARGRGVGRALYEALLPRLAARGYGNAYAGVTLPNDASVALHRSVGFRAIGTFPRVGWKYERWHDVLWLHRPL